MIRALCLIAGLIAPLPVAAQDLAPPRAGSFRIDLGHTRLSFRVSHLGFSMYTAFFREVDATLVFDPDNPQAMQVTATVPAASVETLYPDPALDFNAVVAGPDLLDAAQFPDITFVSTAIALTGPDTADVTGDLTLHGVTRPITLAVTYNGGYGAFAMDPGGARIGFSATSSLNRSEYGMGYGVPAPGSEFGVGDRVEIIIETEFTSADPATP
jgi:polyisoprenoid-binding protein YceI